MLQTIHKKYLACILFAVAVLFFFRTVSFEAVWDDERGYFTPGNQYIMMNNTAAFWKFSPGMYIPLSYTTWALVKKNFSPFSFDTAAFHLLNVLTHGSNGVLLFFLLLLLFKDRMAAFFGSLLFLIHPVQVESVAWISEFRGLYSTFFCLLSLFIFFKPLENPSITSFYLKKNYWFAFIFYSLALLAKPSAIVLPLLIVVLSWRFYNNKLTTILKSLWIWLIPAAFILFSLLAKNPADPVSIGQRFLTAGFTLIFYFQKILLPYPLVACYGYTPVIVSQMAISYAAVILSPGILIFLFLKRKYFPDLYVSILIVFISVLPVLGLIPFFYQTYSTVADRYLYLAMVGSSVFVASAVSHTEKYKLLKWSGILIFLLFAFSTIKQIPVWKNEFALWDHNLKHYQNSATVYYNRGVQYSLKGNFSKALADYDQALRRDPNYLDALFNRANTYENMNEPEKAMLDYNRYILQDAKNGSVYYKRSYLFFKAGKQDEALDDLQRAEELGFSVDRRYKERLLQSRFLK